MSVKISLRIDVKCATLINKGDFAYCILKFMYKSGENELQLI